jgi:para-nitrobenzyl esterase
VARSSPVFVWIRRTGSGGNTAYDGSKFWRDGIVCVSLNYRLDALGRLYVGEDGAGNLALLDQIAALAWVRENIATFGAILTR